MFLVSDLVPDLRFDELHRAAWTWPLLGLLLLFGCDEVRRPPGGGGRSGAVARDSGLSGAHDAGATDAGFDDGGRPIFVDAGFADGGRPIVVDAGFDDGGRPNGGGAVDRTQFCAELWRLRCEANLRCCSGEGRYSSVADCLSRARPCYDGVAFDDGRARFDGATAAEILRDLEAKATRCLRALPWRNPTIGTLGEGGDCSAAGADSSPFYSCAPGLYCEGSESGRAVCKAYAPVGDSCLSRLCEPMAVCDATGRCRGSVALGEACGEGLAICAEGYCSDGLCRSGTPSFDYCGGA